MEFTDAMIGIGCGEFRDDWDDDIHESFFYENRTGLSFCKTAWKSYDKLVYAILNLSRKYYGAEIEVSSDE